MICFYLPTRHPLVILCCILFYFSVIPLPSSITTNSFICSPTFRLLLGKLLALEWFFWAMFRRYLRRWVDNHIVYLCVFNSNFLFFIQKCSFQVSLASEFMCNYLSRDVTASFGYDYILRQVVFSFMNSIIYWNFNVKQHECDYVNMWTSWTLYFELLIIEILVIYIRALGVKLAGMEGMEENFTISNPYITSSYLFKFHSALLFTKI